jgi:hypothetical protein
MFHLPSTDLEAVELEKLKIQQKHATQQALDAKFVRNQRKNRKLYLKLGKGKRAFVNRQCKEHEDERNHVLPRGMFTFFQVQLFDNSHKRGSCNHVLKIEWSNHQDPLKAKLKRYQTVSYFNLYEGQAIQTKARKFLGAKEGKELGSAIRSIKTNQAYDHPIQRPLFGFSTVRKEKAGTVVFSDHQVVALPITEDGINSLELRFCIEGMEIELTLNEIQISGAKRQPNSSRFVGNLHWKKHNTKLMAEEHATKKEHAKKGIWTESSIAVVLEKLKKVQAMDLNEQHTKDKLKGAIRLYITGRI